MKECKELVLITASILGDTKRTDSLACRSMALVTEIARTPGYRIFKLYEDYSRSMWNHFERDRERIQVTF